MLGYDLRNRSVLRYGIDPWLDIERLSKGRGLDVATIFDVGANIGQTAKEFSSRYPGATIFSFEPVRSTFEELRRQVADLPHVRPQHCALGAERRTAEILLYDCSLLNSLALNPRYPQRYGMKSRSAMCRVETVDAFSADNAIPRIDILKIDTEGYDLEVLNGARGLISDGRIQFVFVEFNEILPNVEASGGSLLQIAEFLEPNGFAFIASYTDYVATEGDLFVVCNALFARKDVTKREA